MIRSFRFLNLCSILLSFGSCYPSIADAHDGDHKLHRVSISEETCAATADLGTIGAALPDLFADRDGIDPDDVLSAICADDEPAIAPWVAPALDHLCAEYRLLQIDRVVFVLVTRDHLRIPIAIGYSLGDTDQYVVSVPSGPISRR